MKLRTLRQNENLCSNAGYILQEGKTKVKYGILSNAKILFFDECFLGHPHRFVRVRQDFFFGKRDAQLVFDRTFG